MWTAELFRHESCAQKPCNFTLGSIDVQTCCISEPLCRIPGREPGYEINWDALWDALEGSHARATESELQAAVSCSEGYAGTPEVECGFHPYDAERMMGGSGSWDGDVSTFEQYYREDFEMNGCHPIVHSPPPPSPPPTPPIPCEFLHDGYCDEPDLCAPVSGERQVTSCSLSGRN